MGLSPCKISALLLSYSPHPTLPHPRNRKCRRRRKGIRLEFLLSWKPAWEFWINPENAEVLGWGFHVDNLTPSGPNCLGGDLQVMSFLSGLSLHYCQLDWMPVFPQHPFFTQENDLLTPRQLSSCIPCANLRSWAAAHILENFSLSVGNALQKSMKTPLSMTFLIY